MKFRTLLAALALCAGLMTANAAEMIVNAGAVPGATVSDPWPAKLADGSTVYYGLTQTKNGVKTLIMGWHTDATLVCGLFEQQNQRNLDNLWDRLLGRYKAEMVWIAVKPGQVAPPNVGGDPLTPY